MSPTNPTQSNTLLLFILAPFLIPILSPAFFVSGTSISSLSHNTTIIPSSTVPDAPKLRYTPVPRPRRRIHGALPINGRTDIPEHVERARIRRRRDQALGELTNGLKRGLAQNHAGDEAEVASFLSSGSIQRNSKRSSRSQGKMDLKLGRKVKSRETTPGIGRADDRYGRRAEVNETAALIDLGSGDGIYTIPIQIGSPALTYALQLDTASTDLLLSSSGCTSSSCPLGPPTSDLYRAGRSETFRELNANGTVWNATFGDGTYAAGFVGVESVGMLNAYMRGYESSSSSSSATVTSTTSTSGYVLPEIDGIDGFELDELVFGLINQTTIDFRSEGTQGILGLGFPRGTVLGRAVGKSEGLVVVGSGTTTTGGEGSTSVTGTGSSATTTTESASTVSSGPTAQATATTSPTTSTSTTPYYPTFLETLFASPLLYYPVFALALSNSSSVFSSKTDEATITFGGVSAEFVLPSNKNTTDSGRRVDDIEWWDVVPFARVADAVSGDAGNTTTTTATSSSTASAAAATQSNWLDGLEDQVYLYWALELGNITVNGTDVPLEPTYNSSTTGRTSSVALLDVGTNGIYGPQQDVINIFDQIQDSRVVSDGQWAVPCDSSQTMTFSFGEGGRVVELQPSEWIIGAVAGSSLCLAWPVVAQPSADGVDWQLGTSFLRKVYTVFGYGIDGVQSPVIGFLPLPDTDVSSTANSSGTASSTVASQTSSTTSSGSQTVSTNSSSATTSTTTRDPTDPTPTSVQDASQISSALTITFDTVLPNQVLADPTYTTPAYAFETTSIPTAGELQTVGLANATAYPSIMDVQIVSPSAVTIPTTATSTVRGLVTMSAGSGSSTGSTSGSHGRWNYLDGFTVAVLATVVLAAML